MTDVVSHFKGQRLEELKIRIQELQKKNQGLIMCAITGVAGSGKTELVKAYACRNLHNDARIFGWRLDPDPQMSYQSAYLELLDNFGLTGPNSTSSWTLPTLWDKINQYPQWIVIFDNAVSYPDIQSYLPTSRNVKGVILVTTQNANFFYPNRGINFSINEGLDPDEARRLLLEISNREDSGRDSLELARRLDYLPLGIRVAGAYLEITGSTFEQYIKSMGDNSQFMEKYFKGKDLENLLAQSVDDQKRTLTLQRTIGNLVVKLRTDRPLFIRLLEYCAYLDNKGIPKELVLELFKEETPERSREDLLIKFNVLMRGTENYSLMTYQLETQSYNLHWSTQAVVRNLCPQSIKVIKKVVDIMFQLYPEPNPDPYLLDKGSMERIKICQKMEPHFLALSQHTDCTLELSRDLVTEQNRLHEILGQLIISQLLSEYPDSELLKHKNFVLAAVKRHGWVLQYATSRLQNDEDIVAAAVRQDSWALQFVSVEFRDNKEMVLSVVQHNGMTLRYVSLRLQNDKEIVLAAVRHYGRALQFASEGLRNDKEVVSVAIKDNGHALEFASPELKNNGGIVKMAVVNSYGYALQYASEDLRNDKEIVLMAVRLAGRMLEYASGQLRNNKEIVSAAVLQDGWALRFASEEMKDDKKIVLSVVKQERHGSALYSANQRLQNDREIVLAAMETDGWALVYVSEALKKDREIVLTAVKQTGSALQFASQELRNDKAFVLAAVQDSGWVLQFANEALKNDREVVLTAVKQNGWALQFASEELKNDKAIVLIAVQQSGYALQYASEELRNDPEILKAAKGRK